MRPCFLLVALALACDPGKSSNPSEASPDGRGDGDDDGTAGADGDDGADGDGGDGDGSSGTGGDTLLDLTLDRPAFYDDGATVQVTGTVSPAAAVDALEVGGATATVDSDGAWSADVPLSGAPFSVVTVTAAGVSGPSLSLTAQVAEAEAGGATVPDGLQTAIGRAGGDALAALLGDFVHSDDLTPEAGVVLSQDTCDPCPIGLECPDVDEVLRTTGAASVAVSATLDPSAGRIDLDLSSTTLSWGVEVVHDGYITGTNTGTLDLTLGAAASSSAALPCAGLGLDVALYEAARAWSLTETTYCVDAETLGEGSGLWPDLGQPALEAAACRWGPWLDDAVASDVAGLALASSATADATGVTLDWTATPADAAPWLAPTRPSPLSPDGLDVALRDALLGAALDGALRARLPAAATADLAEGEATITLSGLHADAATLAAVTADGGVALLAPIAYTLELDGVECAAAHLVPAAVDLTVTADGAGWIVAVDGPTAAGADALPACGLDAVDRAALLDAALLELAGDLSVWWTTATGLQGGGATAVSAASAAAYTVAVEL